MRELEAKGQTNLFLQLPASKEGRKSALENYAIAAQAVAELQYVHLCTWCIAKA